MSRWNTERGGYVLFAACLTILGVFILYETLGMPAGPEFAVVGPRAFPGFVGAVLVLLGLFQLHVALVDLRTNGAADRESATAVRYDWRSVVWVIATLASQILLLRWIGWIPAATLVFVGVARAFGSRRLALDAAIGLVLAGTTFTLFNFVLGLNLPTGQLLIAVIGG